MEAVIVISYRKWYKYIVYTFNIMNLILQLFFISLCYAYSKSIYLERGVLLNLFFINPKNKYINSDNWTLLTISLAEIVNINKLALGTITNKYIPITIDVDYLYWWLLCINIINMYTWKMMIIISTLLIFPIPTIYLQYIFTTLYIKNILILLIDEKYYRLMLIIIKSVFNIDVMINRIFHKKETSFISWIYDYIPFYNNDIYEYVPYYDAGGGGGKYIYATNIYSNKIINNINNYINEKCITEAIIFLRIMFLFYYNYYVYKLDL